MQHTPILELGGILVVSIQASLTDADLDRLRTKLADRVGQVRAAGVVIDVSQLDVLDSFASRTLSDIAKVASLRGAQVVIAGIQPDVAFAMVQLGLTLDGVETALDLDEAMTLLRSSKGGFVPRAE